MMNVVRRAFERFASRKTEDSPAAEPPKSPDRDPIPDQTRLGIELSTHLWHALDEVYSDLLVRSEIRCIVCDYASPRSTFSIKTDTCLFGGGFLERYECPSCQCVFGAKKYLDLSEEAVSADYSFLYSYYSEADSTENEIRTFQSLAPRSDGVYLDWGCGGAWSRTISTLRNSGWEIWGYEPSSPRSENFVVRTRDEITGRFHGIFSNNVIEHFRSPVEEFRYFHTLLRDDGVMAHSSPCYDLNYTFTRFHTLFLLGRSPHVLAERCGFKVMEKIEDGEYINVVYKKV